MILFSSFGSLLHVALAQARIDFICISSCNTAHSLCLFFFSLLLSPNVNINEYLICPMYDAMLFPADISQRSSESGYPYRKVLEFFFLLNAYIVASLSAKLFS